MTMTTTPYKLPKFIASLILGPVQNQAKLNEAHIHKLHTIEWRII